MPNNTKRIVFLAPALGWGILICYFSLIPGEEVPGVLKSIRDIVLHFTIYAGLSILCFFGLNRFSRSSLPLRKVYAIVIFCFLLGLIIEVIQEKFVAGRHFEWGDVLFNSLGTLLILGLNKKMAPSKL